MEMKDIEEEIRECKGCRKGKLGLPVPGEGPYDARLMFVGMAPGREEAKAGRPFVGRSGRLLTDMLRSAGIDRKDAYITSPVKYYPGRRNLRKGEIEHGTVHLRKQIDALSPRIIVLMGNVAAEALLPGRKAAASRDHGKTVREGGRTYFLTFHPAAALRFPEIRRMMEQDFRKLKELSDET